MGNIRYSVIIPTYNRSKILERCLNNISLLNKPVGDYEVIVIDNGSTDATKELISSYSGKIRNISYYFEPRQGLHYCRNLALTVAKGDIFCYIDDDSFVNSDWLINTERVFLNEDILIATGPCLPEYETEPTEFIKENWNKNKYGKYLALLSLNDFGEEDKLVPAEFVFGCNFIIRKKIILELEGFHPDAFPKEKIFLRGDGENYITLSLKRKKVKAFYTGGLGIMHFVPANRMSKKYLLRRAFIEGISSSYSDFRYGITNIIGNNSDLNKTKENKLDIFMNFSARILNKMHKILFESGNKLLFEKKLKHSFIEGYNYHRGLLQTDIGLQQWALKKNYLN